MLATDITKMTSRGGTYSTIRKSDLLYFDEKILPCVSILSSILGGYRFSQSQVLYTRILAGIEAQGTIDNKHRFLYLLTTTQMRVPQYIGDFVGSRGSFPYEGFYKIADSDKTEFDIFHARGYFTFNLTKSIDVQTGHDKNFIGNGIRSMIMSDFRARCFLGKSIPD